jgi:hypothetical protein
MTNVNVQLIQHSHNKILCFKFQENPSNTSKYERRSSFNHLNATKLNRIKIGQQNECGSTLTSLIETNRVVRSVVLAYGNEKPNSRLCFVEMHYRT